MGVFHPERNTLTAREKQMLILASSGMSNEEIARKLRIRKQTVKNTLFYAFNRIEHVSFIRPINRHHALKLYLQLPKTFTQSRTNRVDDHDSIPR